ncbi:enolase C-terminal domain-like protein [Pontibacter oryzae]|uniref:Mandelate racemase/muconate lactonizing enzyme C-terminal domain-containing protein n=1 Tax=Pontibacter oryzae TaxID=2304593 RepID=A0A399RRN7_9BACT|nr:enolase C-terminal domain-like protein [Pontibacter oryzae]RIJ33461.1 hypothetical protein D1627_17760 [Pontibacter oryzae]
MLTWHMEALHLKLKQSFVTARGATTDRLNFLVQVSDGTYNGFGEAAPNPRYSETPELILQQYKVLLVAGLPAVKSMEELLELLLEHAPANSLRFAIEAAYLHYFCQHQGIAVHQMLGQPVPKPQPTCFSLSLMEPGAVEKYLAGQQLERFHFLKVKVNTELGPDLVQEVLRLTDQPLVLDGNEGWQDPEELLRFLHALPANRVLFVEQPLPATQVSAYAQLKGMSPVPLVADESVTDTPDFALLRSQFHGLNIKLMRAGGYLNAVRLLQEAERHGLKTVIGCGVETSLGVWCSMQLGSAFDFVDLNSFLHLQEDPFNLVKEQDGMVYLK